MGVDVLLSDISALLAGLNRETPGLAIWIVSDEGRVLASSDEKTFLPHLGLDSAELPDMSGSDFQDLRAAVRALSSTALSAESGFREFKSTGRSFYGLAKPVTISGNLRLSAVIIVPRGSPLSYVESVGWLRIFLFLLFTAGSYALFMWRYLIPIRRLTGSVRTLGTETYVRPPATDRADEVGVLLSEFARVTDDLEVRRRGLAESEARYRRLFESVHDGVFETDADGRFVRANRGMAEIHGAAFTEDMIGRNAVDFWINPDERATYLAALESQKSIGSYRTHARRQDGTPIVVDVSAVRREGPAGEFLGTEGIIRDVTESVESAESLRRAAEEWRTTFDSMSDFVSMHDRNYRIIKANAAMAAFFGMSPAKLVGMNCHQLYHGADSPCPMCPFSQMAAALKTVSAEMDDPHVGVPLTITVSPIVGGDGLVEGCVHVARDVSAQRRLEEQLQQSRKMEAIGRLAGGVAHDFNNMLSVIIGFTEEAIAKLKTGDPAAQDLLEVRSAAERSANLTRQLLAFSRRQPIEPVVVGLNERLRAMEGMLRRLLGEDVQVELDLSPDLWPVLVDPSQVDQAIANLVSNSRDAMPGGGILVVKTGNVTLGALEVENAEGVAEGDYAILAVGDNGQGMGLGLATVYGSVRQNGGWIDADSTPGMGTTIRVYLPRYLGEDGVRSVPALAGSEPAGGETVLLVEDEKQVRRLTRICLERLGYEVIEATGSEEALALCAQHTGKIHLLLSDVVMPRMNGKALAGRVRAFRPGIKVLFMSGYTADVITSRGVLDEGMDFLEKPFTPEGLGRKVRMVLDDP